MDGLPPASADGRVAQRPTLLPLPGEIPVQHPLRPRLARLGRFGSAACRRPGLGNADDSEPELKPATTPEDRLFFNYLRGDFAAAASEIGAVEPLVVSSQQRLALLSLRAQILYANGETTRARGVVDYLIAAEGGPVHRVEETPLGPVLTSEPDSGQTWARYLSSRIVGREAAAPSDSPDKAPADQLPNPFVPVDPFEIERERVGAAPFVPIAPGVNPEPIRRFGGQRAPGADRPPPQPQPQPINPRRRRGIP